MAKVSMYYKRNCPYCIGALQLFAEKGVRDIEKICIDHDALLRQKMINLTGRTTVPQIFIDEYHVGGFDDLCHLEQTSQLDLLLGTV